MKQFVGGQISIKGLKETFQGIVTDKPSQFPKILGAEHPFEFEDAEKLYMKYGLIAETVNKFASAIVTQFQIKVENKNAQTILDDFIHNTDFHRVIEAWVREALLKGNGFIEIDLKESKIRVMNSNYMYVVRDKIGNVKGYNQYAKPLKAFNRDKDFKDVISFKPNEIAHLTINKIPNNPYGIGVIWPNERIIENMATNEQDLQRAVTRKAVAPYHFKVGQPGDNVPASVIDSIRSKLQYLTNSMEWVTDGGIEIKAIDFQNLGKNLTEAQLYWFRMFIAGVGVPEVLFGSGQLNEGIAKVQNDAFKKKVEGFQDLIGHIIEEKIIRPLLKSNSLDEIPKFIWELPSTEDIKNRITQIVDMLSVKSSPSPAMRAQLEIELARLMEFEGLDKVLDTPKEAKKNAEAMQAYLLKQGSTSPSGQTKGEQLPNAKPERSPERKREENIPLPHVPGVLRKKQNIILTLEEKYNEPIYLGELI